MPVIKITYLKSDCESLKADGFLINNCRSSCLENNAKIVSYNVSEEKIHNKKLLFPLTKKGLQIYYT
jgi:hypothetical protein